MINADVTILVRKRGAIGIFYPQVFRVNDVQAPVQRDTVFEAWQKQYGEEWEPHHIQSFVPLESPPSGGVD